LALFFFFFGFVFGEGLEELISEATEEYTVDISLRLHVKKARQDSHGSMKTFCPF